MVDEPDPGTDEHLLKGGRRLRFRNAEDSLREVREGVHRWWWEFLRLSKDYWLVCQTSERPRAATRDEQLARVYRRFGDIHSTSFDDWWVERGYRVFQERERFPKVAELLREPAERSRSKPLDDHLWVDIPLKLSRRTIQRQLGKILDAHEEQRLRNRLELSTSDFKINPVQYRLHTLQKVHEVYTLHRELIAKPAAMKEQGNNADFERRADLFRIGKLLRISPSNEALRGDPQEIFRHQNRMRASVSRLLRRAELLIANAQLGTFPNFLPLAEPIQRRFSTSQLARHQELESQWWQLDLISDLSRGKLEDARRIHYEEVLKTRQAW